MNIDLQFGDCIELMKDIPDASVDMVLTDPPYGIKFQSHRRRQRQARFDVIAGDDSPHFQFICALKRMLKPNGCVAIFTRWDTAGAFYSAMETGGGKTKFMCCVGQRAPWNGGSQEGFCANA